MAPDYTDGSDPSSLPTNTPPYSPGIGERIRAAINPALEKKLVDYKVNCITVLSFYISILLGNYENNFMLH